MSFSKPRIESEWSPPIHFLVSALDLTINQWGLFPFEMPKRLLGKLRGDFQID